MTNDIIENDIDVVFSDRYAVYGSVTVKNRAIPSVYDGLNPVSRKILTTYNDSGYSLKFSKAAMYVGNTLARYAPVGDASVYESMIGLAQPFNKLNPFIDKQGNIGSIEDFKSYAAQRYVELRMSKFTHDTFFDSDYNTAYIPMMDNYDGSLLEPRHLPAKFPVILNSGMLGIGSGFACEIPTHKVDDICNITIKYIDNPDISYKELTKNFRPDFPAGGIITNSSSLPKMYEEGKGSILMEAVIEEGTYRNNEVLIVKELPYKVSTSKILQEIQGIVTSKQANVSEKLNMLADVKDLSSKLQPVELVMIPKRGTTLSVLRNALLQHTSLRTSVKYLPNVLIGDKLVEYASLKTILQGWLDFRVQILSRKFAYEIKRISEQILLKKALIKAHGVIDELIKLLKASKGKEDSITSTASMLKISRREAEYIVSIQLYQISNLEVQKIKDEIAKLKESLDEKISLVSDRDKLHSYIKDELIKIGKKYSSPRRTKLMDKDKNVDVRDTIEAKELMIAISSDNYVYSKDIRDIKVTKHGTKGSNFIPAKYKRVVRDFFKVNSHDDLYVFTKEGKVLELKGYQLDAWHKPLASLIDLQGQTIVNVIKVNPVEDSDKYILLSMVSSKMKLVKVSEFEGNRIPKGGKLATKLVEGDSVLCVHLVDNLENIGVIAINSNGYGQNMSGNQLDIVKRPTYGFPKFSLKKGEYLASVTVFNRKEEENPLLFIATSKGLAIITNVNDIPLRRGDSGMRVGVKLINLDNDSNVVDSCIVKPDSEVLITSTNGKSVRSSLKDIRTTKRGTKGVRVIKLDDNETLMNVSLI